MKKTLREFFKEENNLEHGSRAHFEQILRQIPFKENVKKPLPSLYQKYFYLFSSATAFLFVVFFANNQTTKLVEPEQENLAMNSEIVKTVQSDMTTNSGSQPMVSNRMSAMSVGRSEVVDPKFDLLTEIDLASNFHTEIYEEI